MSPLSNSPYRPKIDKLTLYLPPIGFITGASYCTHSLVTGSLSLEVGPKNNKAATITAPNIDAMLIYFNCEFKCIVNPLTRLL